MEYIGRFMKKKGRILAALLAICTMLSGFEAFAKGQDPITRTYGDYTLTKVSNPASGSGKADGINTNDTTGYAANRLNSYAWAVASRGNYIYIGTNRTLFGSALNAVVETLQQKRPDLSQEAVGNIIKVISGGDVPVNLKEKDYIPQIIKFDVKKGKSEVIYQPETKTGSDGRLYYTDKDGQIIPSADVASETASFRSVIQYKGNLYFGSLGTNMLQLVRVDKNDKAEVVFQTLGLISSLRACAVYDDGNGETVYFGGQDTTYKPWLAYRKSHVGEAYPLPIVIRYLDPKTAGKKQENWDGMVADYNDFGKYAYASVYVSGGGNVWDLCSYNGKLYLILAYDGGWAMFRGEKGGKSPNKFGWTWTEIVGDNGRYPLAMNKNVAKLNKQYAEEYGCSEYNVGNLNGSGLLESTATPYVYNGKMYIGTFDNATMLVSQTVIKALLKLSSLKNISTGDETGPTLEQIFAPFYEALSHPQHVWVMDKNEKITAVDEANELLEGTTVDYVWRFAEYEGKLYTGTFDAASSYVYFLDYSMDRAFKLLKENVKELPEHLRELTEGTFSAKLKELLPDHNSMLGATALRAADSAENFIQGKATVEALLSDMTEIEKLKDTDWKAFLQAALDAIEEEAKELKEKAEALISNATEKAAEIIAAAKGLSRAAIQKAREKAEEFIQEAKEKAAAIISETTARVVTLYQEVKDKIAKAKEMIQWLLKYFDVDGLIYWAKARALVKKADKGFDLFVTDDGTDWERITDDGLGDPYNYGARTFTICNNELYIGTANPYYGAQLWKLTDNTELPCAKIIEKPKALDPVYNGKANKLVTAGSCEGGTLFYAIGDSKRKAPETGWSTSVPTAVKTGTYYVWYMVVGDRKHEDTEPKCVTSEILPGKEEKKEDKKDDKKGDDKKPDTGTVKNQWKKINGKWYFFDKNGNQEKDAYRNGWYIKEDGTWNGVKKKAEWKKNSKGWWYSLPDGSYLKNTWKKIDGKWYYFKADGYMAANEYIDGYWLSSNGAWTYKHRARWTKTTRGWRYSDKTGWYAKGASYTIDGIRFTFNNKGYWEK